jgi:hypothetical protein
MLITYSEWLNKMKEMAGTGTIVTKKDCHNPDFQVWGAVCDDVGKPKPPGAKKKKKA